MLDWNTISKCKGGALNISETLQNKINILISLFSSIEFIITNTDNEKITIDSSYSKEIIKSSENLQSIKFVKKNNDGTINSITINFKIVKETNTIVITYNIEDK